jgi:hypothetical protein
MAVDGYDRHLGAILGWLGVGLAGANGLAGALHLEGVQAITWPTDLATLHAVDRHAPVDVAVVGSSRAHYALPPSALDACLSTALGRPTETVAVNRMRASGWALDLAVRDELTGPLRPRTLVVEVSPEMLSDHPFDLASNVVAAAHTRDVPACLGAALDGDLPAATCARPLTRGVENLAFTLARPWSDHAHLTWMALHHGGGQYCYDDAACLARNGTYDAENAARWESRAARVLPQVASERFRDWALDGGLAARHVETLLERARADGQRVMLVNLPVSAAYQAQVPPAAYATTLAWVRAAAERHGATFLDANTPAWQADRTRFLDPDHLNAAGAAVLSREVCAALVDDAVH